MNPPPSKSLYRVDIEGLLSNSRYLIVGVTGHRDLLPNLLPNDEEKSRRKEDIEGIIKEKLSSLRTENPGRTLVLLSALALGADQLVAKCLDEEDQLVRLYNDHEDKLTETQRYERYVRMGEFLTQHCDHLIALWDGVDGGGLGDTSDVVRMWVKGKGLNGKPVKRKNKPQTLHQLVLPRQQNHFPLGRRFDSEEAHLPVGWKYKWIKFSHPIRKKLGYLEKITQWATEYIAWIVVGLSVFFVLYKAISPINLMNRDLLVFSLLIITYILACWAYFHYKLARSILREFIYPIALALCVLGIGTWGFNENGTDLGNSFFSAANLITLNQSVWPNDMKLNGLLEIARILGGFLAGYAFILAFSLAVGKEGISRLRFWLFRKILPKEFAVVIGDGTMALDTVLDLEGAGKRVVMLDEGRNPVVQELLNARRVWYMKGNLTSQTALQKTYFHEAAEVYVLCDSDEENFRISQEMDDVPLQKKKWYIHMSDLRQRVLLHQLLRKDDRQGSIRMFSVHENTARRLLSRYPVDRFTNEDQRGARIVLLGFGPLAREIALTCLRLGHYTEGRYLTVKVYYPSEKESQVAQFRADHPELFRRTGAFRMGPAYDVQYYTFFESLPKGEAPIVFEALPAAESDLRAADFSLYDLIRPSHVMSVYACLDSGIASARILGAILPRLQWLKQAAGQANTTQTDVQAFCFYNFPDRDEEEYLETRLNALAPYLMVVCFGNYIEECSVSAIRNEEMNRIARRLALLYACLYENETAMLNIPDLEGFVKSAKKAGKDYKEAQVDSVKSAEEVESESKSMEKIHIAKLVLSYMDQDCLVDKVEEWAETIWNNILEDERESNIQAADHAWVKLRSMNKPYESIETPATFWTEDQLAVLSELEHRRWNAEKLTLGWLPFPDAKLWKSNKESLKAQQYHYHLVPYAKLPPEEQNKDRTQVLGLPYFFKGITSLG